MQGKPQVLPPTTDRDTPAPLSRRRHQYTTGYSTSYRKAETDRKLQIAHCKSAAEHLTTVLRTLIRRGKKKEKAANKFWGPSLCTMWAKKRPCGRIEQCSTHHSACRLPRRVCCVLLCLHNDLVYVYLAREGAPGQLRTSPSATLSVPSDHTLIGTIPRPQHPHRGQPHWSLRYDAALNRAESPLTTWVQALGSTLILTPICHLLSMRTRRYPFIRLIKYRNTGVSACFVGQGKHTYFFPPAPV